jgi:hypothetical protein
MGKILRGCLNVLDGFRRWHYHDESWGTLNFGEQRLLKKFSPAFPLSNATWNVECRAVQSVKNLDQISYHGSGGLVVFTHKEIKSCDTQSLCWIPSSACVWWTRWFTYRSRNRKRDSLQHARRDKTSNCNHCTVHTKEVDCESKLQSRMVGIMAASAPPANLPAGWSKAQLR